MIQQQRSLATQQRLLDATIDCLIKYGWSGTTTTIVAETAGVSRGAQLHHYPTKAALVLASVEHLTRKRAEEIRAEAGGGAHHVEHVIELLEASFTGPMFQAALEVWVAARTDDALRDALVPLEATIGRELYRLTVDMLGADDRRPEVRDAIQATLELLRGLGVASLLSDDSARRRSVLSAWTRHLEDVLAEGHDGTSATTHPKDALPDGSDRTTTTAQPMVAVPDGTTATAHPKDAPPNGHDRTIATAHRKDTLPDSTTATVRA